MTSGMYKAWQEDKDVLVMLIQVSAAYILLVVTIV